MPDRSVVTPARYCASIAGRTGDGAAALGPKLWLKIQTSSEVGFEAEPPSDFVMLRSVWFCRKLYPFSPTSEAMPMPPMALS